MLHVMITWTVGTTKFVLIKRLNVIIMSLLRD